MAFFDPTRAAYLANPYPSLARLRREAPVHWSPEYKSWVLTRFADCAEVLRDSARFTTDPARTDGPRARAILAHRAGATLGEAPSLGTTSGAQHRTLRRIVNPVFSPAAVRRQAECIATMTTDLLEEMPAAAPVEFMTALANPLPRRVVGAMLGFPEVDAERIGRLLTVIQVSRANPALNPAVAGQAVAAREELAEYFEDVSCSATGDSTVLGALVRARAAGGLCTDDVISVVAHIATVGSDPTSGAIANAVAALAAAPGAFAQLRSDPARIPAAVHELLRFDCPTHIAPRFAVMDCELGGRRIRRGDSLLAVVGAANRDPAVFERPDELDINRDARRQLGFGQGEHICLGAPLAVNILESVLTALSRRFTRIEALAPPDYGASVELRIPDKMMVRFC
jgi:cytochrome P450